MDPRPVGQAIADLTEKACSEHGASFVAGCYPSNQLKNRPQAR
jgi:hypothetical protein